MIFLPGFDLEAILRWMPAATALMGVPTFYTRLLSDPRLTRALAAGMRLFVSGSAPLLADTHAEFEARTGHRILERYGMTGNQHVHLEPPTRASGGRARWASRCRGVELRILDQGREVAPGEIGVIEVRGPNVFQGYWQMPEKTAEELRPDGFFVTGDLGCRDAEGYVQIVGRQKDLIISGGYNIYPKEVELLLDEQPGVLESAVVGLPLPDLGEAALAVLVPRPGVTLDPQAVLGAIADRLARFKQPRAAVLVEELPRNTMGKVQKTLLRARYAGLFA